MADDARSSTEGPAPSNRKRDLRNLSLDPTDSTEADPESWDERPASGDDAAKYLIDKPPHHGD